MRFLIAFLFSITASASLNDVSRQELFSKNLAKNGGFENGKAFWTASAGSFAVTTSSPMIGGQHATWDAAASADTLTYTAQTIPVGMYGRNGAVSCLITTPSGTATHSIQAYDGSTILSSVTITSSTVPVRSTANFVIPSSGSISLRIYSNANEPSISIDDCFMGPAEGFNLGQATPQDVFSAAVSSTDVVSQENLDWINGNCTNATTGKATCNFTSGLFSATPNCTATGSSATDGRILTIESVSSSSIIITSTDDAGTLADIGFQLTCQKSGADALQVSLEVDMAAWKIDANISGADITLGTAAQTAYVTPNNAGLTLTQNSGSSSVGISCSSTNDNTVGATTCSAGSEEPGVVFNLPRSGTVRACFSFAHQIVTAATGVVNTTFQVVQTANGSQTVAIEGKSRVQSGLNTASSTITFPHRVCGELPLSQGKNTVRLMYEQAVTATVTSSNIFADAGANNGQRDVHVTVEYIDQQFKAPLLVNSVVNSSISVTAIEAATLNCDSSATITSQQGNWISSIGNVSAGACILTLQSGIFSSAPRCTLNQDSAVNPSTVLSITSTSATSITTDCDVASTGTDCTTYDFQIICVGAK